MSKQNRILSLIGIVLSIFIVGSGCQPDCNYKGLKKYNVTEDYREYDSEKEFGYQINIPSKKGKLPLVILLHSGAFIKKYGHKEGLLVSLLGRKLSEKGIVTASIDYTTLETKIETMRRIAKCTNMQNLKWDGIVRGIVAESLTDLNNAVEHFKYNAEYYSIDTTNIFIVGYSAGAILALNHAFLDSLELNQFCPTKKQNLGNIGSKVKGVVSISGALFNIDHIDYRDNDTAVLLLHGENDMIVPYNCGEPLDKFFAENVEIDLVGLVYELNLRITDESGKSTLLSAQSPDASIKLKKLPRRIKNLLSPNLCGPGALEEVMSLSEVDSKIVTIKEAGHSFMMKKNGGIHKNNFNEMYREIMCFILEKTQDNGILWETK